MCWHYPLIRHVRTLYRTVHMQDVLVLACQHLLGPQYLMFRSFVKLGLKPRNCIVTGKGYSTNFQVYRKLRNSGFRINPQSGGFSREEPFDTWFERTSKEFVGNELASRNLDQYRKIVLLDDGGFLHTVCADLLRGRENVASVEQTSSGHDRVMALGLPFNLLSIARSYLKQRREAPYIANSACLSIVKHLEGRKKRNPKILVLGLGTIGRQVLGRLKLFEGQDAFGFDRNIDAVYDKGPIPLLDARRCILRNWDKVLERVSEFDVIIGASGRQLFDEMLIPKLHPFVSLISLSSSDREFPAVYFRRGNKGGIHDDYYLGNQCLVNGGFPINFHGNYHEMPAREIELTIACLTAAVLHQSQLDEESFPFAITASRLESMWKPE